MRFVLIACFAALIGSGCAGQAQSPSTLPLGQPFQLRAGTSATLAGGLKVAFDSVRSDSRCPMDAICVWAGDAIVVVQVSQGSGAQVQRELHTDQSGSEASVPPLAIRLVALAPYPRSDRQIQPQDYIATFSVQRP